MPTTAAWLAPTFRLRRPDAADVTAGDLRRMADEAAARVAGRGGRLTIDARRPEAAMAALCLAEMLPLDIALARDAMAADLDPSTAETLAPGLEAWLDAGGPAGDAAGCVRLGTSGTTGRPKLVRHSLDRLLAPVRRRPAAEPAVWLLAYEPASFAGLQVLLTAAVDGATVVAPPRTVPALVAAAVAERPTHISATPSFWRAFLSALPTGLQLPLRVATLGGEASVQDLLDAIAVRFPRAALRHIYASTEAGVGFTVADKRAGFPAAWLDTGVAGARLRVRDGELEVRTPHAMLGYDGSDGAATADGWLRTGDVVEVSGDRVLFLGRRDSLVNIGGAKIVPEDVEARLAGVPGLVDLAVTARANPILGHILTAEAVAAPGADPAAVEMALRQRAEALLPAVARPARYRFVDSLMTPSGKKDRTHA